MAKTPCPISRSDFLDKAEPVKVSIDGKVMLAEKREFRSGSFGWYINAKTVITVGGRPLNVQGDLNLTVVGSKEAER